MWCMDLTGLLYLVLTYCSYGLVGGSEVWA